MTLNTVRAAVAARFATITGLRMLEAMPQRLDPPQGFVGTMTRNPNQSFEGATASPTLGGQGSCKLLQVQSPVTVDIAGVQHLGAQFTIEVFH